MCIIFFDHQPAGGRHGYKLVLAANRDEDFRRPAAPAAIWERAAFSANTNVGAPFQVLSGVDLTPGKPLHGTWLGVTPTAGTTSLPCSPILADTTTAVSLPQTRSDVTSSSLTYESVAYQSSVRIAALTNFRQVCLNLPFLVL